MRPLPLTRIVLYGVANMGSNLVYAFANFAFPLFLSAYQIPNLAIGFLAQERSFVGGFVQPIVGAISDRMPPNPLGRRRPFFLVGIPLTALSLVFLSTYPPLGAVVVVMTLFSFFLAVAHDPYMALLPDITPSEQRGRVGGVLALFNMLGGITVIVLSFLLWESNQSAVFYLVALGLVGTYAVTFFGVEEPPIPPTVAWRARRWSLTVYLRDLLARRELTRYLVAIFFFWLGNGGITPFVTRFGVEVLGVEENVSFLLVLPAILGAALFAVPAGLATERFGKKPVLGLGLFLFGGVALVGGQLVQSLPHALLLMSIIGLANAITAALILPLLADLIPRQRAGEFTGIGSLLWSLAQPIGAVGAGAMADATGSLRGAFAAGGAAMLIASVLLRGVHPERAVEETPNR
ncbi:MAG: MFS transporter [Sphingomonadaceae bacterium]